MTLDFHARPNALPWPPVIFGAAWICGFALEHVLPTGGVLPGWTLTFGRALAALGIGLDIWAMAAMTSAGTNIMPNHSARHLVTSGPFSWTRNPIYLGNTVFTLGIGLGIGALWFLPLGFAAALIVERLAILREEAHLASRFGAEWTAYAARTPRWFWSRGPAGGA